ncbi:MAG: DinB family protein [Bacillota bacterium]|nr:DinB family protein [Bacillota bacterium]
MTTSDWRNSLVWGLRGLSSHVEPARAVRGLTAEAAAAALPRGLHSAHRLLHHIVYWQDLMLAPAAGEKVQWPQGPEDWDCPMAPWGELVGRFEAGLAKAERLAREADLSVRIPEWGPEMTVGGALGVLVTHNSYHIAQLVDVRKAAGHWPPPAAPQSTET